MTDTPRLTARQAAIIGAYTGTLIGQMGDLHAYIEEKLGRPVHTHEMAEDRLWLEIKAATKGDLIAIVPDGTDTRGGR